MNSMLGHLGRFNEYVLRSRVKEFGDIMRLFDVDGDYMRVTVKQGMSGRRCVAAA